MNGQRVESLHRALAAMMESNDIESFAANLPEVFAPLAAILQSKLTCLTGIDYGSLEENQQIAAQIQDLAITLGYGFVCPKCGEPAWLRCSRTNGCPHGSFQYEHYYPDSGRRTRHSGSSVVPNLILVPLPNRNRHYRARRRMKAE